MKTANLKSIARSAELEELDKAEARILADLQAQIAALKSNAGEALKIVSDRRRGDARKKRNSERKKLQGMAFVVGEFLLRNGAEDPTVQAIVGTEAFDEFTKSQKYRGRRELFGLAPIEDSKPAKVAKRTRAKTTPIAA